MNSPKEDLAIQLRVWRRYAVIAVPFWHRGAEAERVFAQLLDYLKVIRSAAGYFAYDRQAGLAFDPIATEMLQSSQYVSVLEMFRKAIAAHAGKPSQIPDRGEPPNRTT